VVAAFLRYDYGYAIPDALELAMKARGITSIDPILEK
jgi:hypothetical protein